MVGAVHLPPCWTLLLFLFLSHFQRVRRLSKPGVSPMLGGHEDIRAEASIKGALGCAETSHHSPRGSCFSVLLTVDQVSAGGTGWMESCVMPVLRVGSCPLLGDAVAPGAIMILAPLEDSPMRVGLPPEASAMPRRREMG